MLNVESHRLIHIARVLGACVATVFLATGCTDLDQEIRFIKTANVLSSTGYPTVNRVGRSYILAPQSVLYLNDVITTDAVATVALQLTGGSRIELGNNSSLLFSGLSDEATPPGIGFTLTRGSLMLSGNKSGARNYEIATSMALIETGSEHFWLGYSAARDSIDIVSLGVEPVLIKNGDGSVLLTAPYEATTIIGASAPQAIKKWAPEKFSETLGNTRDQRTSVLPVKQTIETNL